MCAFKPLRRPLAVVSEPRGDEVRSSSSLSTASSGATSSVTLHHILIRSVEEFLVHNIFREKLASGVVFIQNQQPLSDRLIELARQQGPDIRYKRLRESEIDVNELVDSLILKRPRRGSAIADVIVLDCDESPSKVPQALLRLSSAPGQRRGLWVRGHLEDMRPAHFGVFDVLFICDAASKDIEKLRSALPIPKECGQALRNTVQQGATSEAFLVAMRGTDRRTGSRQTVISDNPAVLRFRTAQAPLPTNVYPVLPSQ